ncbi:maleylpyruvate isomerase family mycothiol-dependent enzyme [Gordonia sputi]|nr:maleylpyruvate isomerase family mycothiol-dependent enzyme [Gordonia sputi]OBA34861.1 hypothetical protein A5766_10645 [Gordonia sp. 852002-51296_SCH5728562-b]
MSDDETFEAIADERRSLANTLATLTPAQWDHTSLCGEWTVRDVAAHLVAPLVIPIWRFGVLMLRARGNFDEANKMMTDMVVRQHGTELVSLLRDRADKRFTPPGRGPAAPLTDIVVHALDICRPLGFARSSPDDRRVVVLDYVTGLRGRDAFTHSAAAVRWEATDIDWRHGDGPTVRGTADTLMLAITGRRSVIDELSGDGVSLLGA